MAPRKTLGFTGFTHCELVGLDKSPEKHIPTNNQKNYPHDISYRIFMNHPSPLSDRHI